MSAVAIFTDEDVYAAVAPALRKAGLDAVSTHEVGRRGESDAFAERERQFESRSPPYRV